MPAEKEILEQLKTISNPVTGKALAVSAIVVKGGVVSFAIDIDPRHAKEMEAVRVKARDLVQKLPGVTSVQAVLTAEKKAPQKTNFGTHKISQRPVAPDVKNIIAVASGKGGVGKSTVSSNLALALSALGKKTGLLDADVYGASQPMMMGIRKQPEMNDNDMIIPQDVHGIKLMSMGFFVEPEKPMIWRGPMVHSALQQLLRDVDWGALDVLVLDLPPGTGDIQLSLAQNVKLAGAIIVSTPQDIALSEAVKGLRMFEKMNVPILGIIENMSYHTCSSCGHRDHIFGHGGARKKAADLGVEFLGEIPLLTEIREKSDTGLPIVAADPLHPAADAFKNIAARVLLKMGS